MTHDEIAEIAFSTITVAHERGITDPLRLAHAVAVALKTAEGDQCSTCGHSTAPLWFGEPGSGEHSEDDGSCFACGPDAKPCSSLAGDR